MHKTKDGQEINLNTSCHDGFRLGGRNDMVERDDGLRIKSGVTEGNGVTDMTTPCHAELVSASINNVKSWCHGFRLGGRNDKLIQSGRSMVEMLGTLAIMGVLTIGGIAGYRYAINKSNANTILNAVSQMAVTASTELTTQGSLTLSEWKDESGNLKINGAYGVETEVYDDGTFGLIVSDIPNEVCDRIQGMDWKLPEDILINENDNCDGNDDNNINFIFSDTLNNMGNRDSDGNCRKGYTGPDCQDKIECQNGGTWTPQGCDCPEGLYGAACDTDCDGFKDNDGTCQPCDLLTALKAPESECNHCSKRQMSGEYCILKDCPKEYAHNTIGTCLSCSRNVLSTKSLEECEKCKRETGVPYWYRTVRNTIYICNPCAATGNQMIPSGSEEACSACSGTKYPRFVAQQMGSPYCASCETTWALAATESECNKCSQRHMKGSYCVLNACPDDHPIQDNSGFCQPCDYEYSITTTQEECDKCIDRIYLSGYNRCVPACTSDKPMMGLTGTCYSCTTTSAPGTSQEECAKCPGRFYEDGKCYLPCSDSSKPILSSTGTCSACDATAAIVTKQRYCDLCSERQMSGNYCILKDCPDSTYVRGSTGACLSCQSTSNISVSVETCDSCTAMGYPRFMNRTNGYCSSCTSTSSLSSTAAECAKCGELRTYDTETEKCNLK